MVACDGVRVRHISIVIGMIEDMFFILCTFIYNAV